MNETIERIEALEAENERLKHEVAELKKSVNGRFDLVVDAMKTLNAMINLKTTKEND